MRLGVQWASVAMFCICLKPGLAVKSFSLLKETRSAKIQPRVPDSKTLLMYSKNSSPVHPGIPHSSKSSFTPRTHRVPLMPLDPPKNLLISAIFFFQTSYRMRLSILSATQFHLTIIEAWTRLICNVPICCGAYYFGPSILLLSFSRFEED